MTHLAYQLGFCKRAGGVTMGDMSPLAPGSLGTPWSPYAYGGVNPAMNQYTGVAEATGAVMADTSMDPYQKALAITVIQEAAGDKPHGLVTTSDLVRGAVGLGLGYTAGSLFGKVLGAVGTLPPTTQKTLARVGAIGGLLRATGIWSD